MVDSQPGTVAAFDPSLTLDDFSASSRDRFMFDENQLVLAKLQQPRPIFSSATNRSSSNVLTVFGSYLNLDGEYVYIDRSFQALATTGVPTLSVHQITVGFDQQVTTNVVKFWSVGFVDTALLVVQYSFDNVTWFNAGAVTWVQDFDDTIQIDPDDSPPTGEFVYTGTIGAGDTTARYWRIRSDAEQAVTNFGSGTVTVATTANFPTTSASVVLLNSSGGLKGTGAYTGKSGTTLTGWTGTTPAAGDTVINIDDPYANQVTEVEILTVTGPILERWNSDGSQAVTNAVEGENYLDAAYDKNDDVFYAIRFDDALASSITIDPDDNFNDTSFGSSFDPSRWVESETNLYFIHNTASGTLDMTSAGGAGQLESNYGIDGDFKMEIDLVGAVRLASKGYFGIEVKDYESGNQYLMSALKGPYTPGSDTSGKFVGAAITYVDTVGSSAELQNFHLRGQGFEFGIGGGSVTYQMTYDSSSNIYAVMASGVTHPNLTPGVPYTMDSAEFTISNLVTPANGQGFTVTATCAQTSIAGTAASGIALEIERIGTNGYLRYEDTDTPGVETLMVGNVPSGRVSLQVFGHPNSQNVSIAADNFNVTGGSVFFDTPVLSVVTLDKNGDLKQVSGISDVDGYAIKVFDVIQDPQATYNDYLAPRVAIATNGAAEGAGGEIYIKINDTLYKYLKTALPIVQDTGILASIVTTGQIPETGITNFAYNGYSQGGLSYIEFINDLSGVFVKSIYTTTMLASSYKAMLDVATIDYPFAWNVSDLATLYFVDGVQLKLYDLNETKAGFVNVTSNKQVLAAGTGETATITGQVLNVYGEPKSAKTMTFSVTAGDGAISPATGCSNVSGIDTTTYTVGSAVGTATLTVSVSDVTCVP